MPRRRRSIFAGAAFLALLAMAAALAPVQVGGSVGYVIVSGNSMEPRLHGGDLVLTWRTGEYRPGDVVAYRQPRLAYVIHRIIDFDGERFTLKGDNNHFVDSYRPARHEIIGKQWLRIPHAGSALVRLREPGIAAAVIVLGVATFGSPLSRSRPDRNTSTSKRRGRSTIPAVPGGEWIMQFVWANAKDLAALAGVALVAFGFLAAAALARPTTAATTVPASFDHTGNFSYFAQALRDGVYDGTGAETGDPVYTQVSDAMLVRFAYRFESDSPYDVSGVIRLDAEVTSDGGWTRTIPLAAPVPFSGPAAAVEGRLVLADVTALVQKLEAETGVVSRRYGVNVVAHVQVEGTLAGVPLASTAAPALRFDLEPGRLSVSRALLATEANPYAPREAGSVAVPTAVPATLPLLGADVPVTTARTVGLAGVGITLLVVAGLAFVLARAWHRARHPDLPPDVAVVRVRSALRRRGGPVVDVDSLDDLVRVAARHDGVLLREDNDDGTTFIVADRVVSYRFHVPACEPIIGGRREDNAEAMEAA
ncbi:MAG: hypothetical protein Kow0010_14610 [Dehalococcoidia bacterium]